MQCICTAKSRVLTSILLSARFTVCNTWEGSQLDRLLSFMQNFEVFEEDPNSSRGGRSTRRADPHFIGYTFKNWEVTAAVRGAAAETGADPALALYRRGPTRGLLRRIM